MAPLVAAEKYGDKRQPEIRLRSQAMGFENDLMPNDSYYVNEWNLKQLKQA